MRLCYNIANSQLARRMNKDKENSSYHGVWCSSCRRKSPSKLTGAAVLVPVRAGRYDMIKGTIDFDTRLKGSCRECLSNASEFQRDIKQHRAVDVDNKDLVYRCVE